MPKQERHIQTRLELEDAYTIPPDVDAKRILDKNNNKFLLLDSDFLTLNKPIRDWLVESRGLLISNYSRASKQEEIKQLSFIDGINHVFNILLTELSQDTGDLEESIINFTIPLIGNYCPDCKLKID